MPSAFETVATAIIGVFNTEFAAEGFTMIPDRLHESLGRERVAVGVSPVEDVSSPRNRIVQETWAEVQFFGLWTNEIDPETVVNPYVITGYAERLRDALRRSQATDPGTGRVWYFDVDRIQYPNDPTGNKTRFVATIRAFGNNSNLVETTS